MKNYLFKPKVVNLTLSHNQEKDEDIKYHSETKIQKEIFIETNNPKDFSKLSNSKLSPDSNKDNNSFSKDISKAKHNGNKNKNIRILKINLNTARSLSKNRKFSTFSEDSNKYEMNIQEDYSSNNISVSGLSENLYQEKITNSLGEIKKNLQIMKEEKFGRSVSPHRNMKETHNVEISLDENDKSCNVMNNNKSVLTLNLMRLKNKLKTNQNVNRK